MSHPTELLRVEGLRAAYIMRAGDLPVCAVDDVSLVVRPGEVLGVAGESGCGKSTLAAVLALNARPPLYVQGGSMMFDGESVTLADTSQIPADWRGKMMSLLPQGAMNALNPTARVRDLAVDVIRAHEPGISGGAAIARAADRMQQLGLPPRALDSYPHELSGGMRQRVVCAVSTILNPRVLIADEPTSALDVSSQRALVLMLKELLAREFIRGVVFISHDLALLSNIADRIAIMYAGQIVETAPVASIIRRPQHPYTRALIGSALVPDRRRIGRRIEGIAGAPPDLRYPPPGCRFHPRCPLASDRCRHQPPPEVSCAPDVVASCWESEQFALVPVS
jgi:peptide/nickel transport system ATP-binding protein